MKLDDDDVKITISTKSPKKLKEIERLLYTNYRYKYPPKGPNVSKGSDRLNRYIFLGEKL